MIKAMPGSRFGGLGSGKARKAQFDCRTPKCFKDGQLGR